MSSLGIKKNQVVWAKLKGYPWWPSSVSSVNGQDVVVNFLGENSHATVRSNQVFDFKESYGQFIKGVNDRKKKLKEAVAIALRISEGKTTYDEERRTMKRFQQMDEENEDDDENEEIEELNDGISDSISKHTSSVTKNRSARKAQQKRASSVVEINENKLNLLENGVLNSGKNENHGEFSLSVEDKQNTHSGYDNNNNTPSNKDSSSNNNNNCKTSMNNQNNVIESKIELAFPLGDDTNDSNYNTNNNVDLAIPQEDQQLSDLGVTAGQQDSTYLDKELLRNRSIEAEEEDMELEKIQRVRATKEKNNSAVNISNTTQSNQIQPNSISESLPVQFSFSGRPQRQKRKNGLQMQFLSEQPWKKQYLNGNSSLVSTLESLLHTISTMNKPHNSTTSTTSTTSSQAKLLKEIDAACQQFEISSMNAADLIKAGVGKLFFSIQTFISVMKQQEFQGMYMKLGKILEEIRDKVLVEALGEDILQHRLFKKNSNTNNLNGDHIRSDKSQGLQTHQQLPQQDQEDHKKLKEKQLRQKVFKKLNDLLMTNHGVNKETAQKISIGIEKKIYAEQPELNCEYRNHVKGIIRIIKNKEISYDKLESSSVEELLQMIKIENIQADLKASGVQFDKATLNDNEED